MPDSISADDAIPNYFLQITAVLSDGEQLLGSIAPDQMLEQVAKALDDFSVAKGLLAQLQGAVNVLKGDMPSAPDPVDNSVGRSITIELPNIGLVQQRDTDRQSGLKESIDWKNEFKKSIDQEVQARTLLEQKSITRSPRAIHALSHTRSGETLCGQTWAGQPEIRLGMPTPENLNNPHGTVTCRDCRKIALSE